MKSFRTILPNFDGELKINHQTGVCFLGSCFTEHIGRKLQTAKFNILQNPFGILYNPFSIGDGLLRMIDGHPFGKKDLVERNGLWMSFAHHSRFSGLDREKVLEHINQSLIQAHQFLEKAEVLFISLGTAKSYRLKNTQKVVANCHKFPASNFDFFLATTDAVVSALTQVIQKLKVFNPGLQIIFTVSPVRHLKDGLIENQQSKATLLLAVAQLQKQWAHVRYFPSYEIMMDDLRDYRFYAYDRIHPNEEAIDYIFDYFSEAYFTEDTRLLIKKILKINNAISHRPFNKESADYQDFVKSTIEKISELEQQNKFLSFGEEKRFLMGNLCS